MRIACIGWGSLINNSAELLIEGKWHNDGPLLPIEFARQSRDGRLTLVIVDNAQPVSCLWVLMSTDDLEIAKKSLCIREGIPEQRMNDFIGFLEIGEEPQNSIQVVIRDWLLKKNMQAAIWTNLPPKFNNKNGCVPSLAQALSYLRNLDAPSFKKAIDYIVNTPKQVITSYRPDFEKEFDLK